MNITAYLGWGVALVEDEYGEAHPSIRDALLDVEDMAKRYPGLAYVDAGFPDNDVHRPVVFVRSTLQEAGLEVAEVEIRPFTQRETVLIAVGLRDFLDETGFTGDREVRFLLATQYED